MMRCTKCGSAIAQGWEKTHNGKPYHSKCHPHAVETVPGVAADRVVFDPPVRVPISPARKKGGTITDVERVFEVTVQGPELAACFTNDQGDDFRLSVNVVLDKWPPDLVQLRLEGPHELDDTVTYAKTEEAQTEDEQGAAG